MYDNQLDMTFLTHLIKKKLGLDVEDYGGDLIIKLNDDDDKIIINNKEISVDVWGQKIKPYYILGLSYNQIVELVDIAYEQAKPRAKENRKSSGFKISNDFKNSIENKLNSIETLNEND